MPDWDTWEGAAGREKHPRARGMTVSWFGIPSPACCWGNPAQPITSASPSCCLHFFPLSCTGGERQAAFPRKRQALGYIIDLLGKTLAGGQWENRADGPHERMACPASDQYASANQGAGAGKARSFLCSVFLVEKIDKQIGLRILDIEKGITSLFTE